jgi:type IV pilus assembly protein PilB
MAERHKILLGQLLVAAGALTEEELETALFEQRRSKCLLGEAIVRLGFATELVVAEAISEQTGIPFRKPATARLPEALRQLVAASTCRLHRLVPLEQEGGVLRLAMANPFDAVALEFIHATTGLTPFPAISRWSDVEQAINRSYAAP